MNWDDQTRTMSWVTVEIVDSSGYQYYWYTWDGWFDGYLDSGTYQVTVTEWIHNEGHHQIMFTLSVNQGEQNDSAQLHSGRKPNSHTRTHIDSPKHLDSMRRSSIPVKEEKTQVTLRPGFR